MQGKHRSMFLELASIYPFILGFKGDRLGESPGVVTANENRLQPNLQQRRGVSTITYASQLSDDTTTTPYSLVEQ